MPRLSKIGAAALAAFGWTGISSVSASYLVVAGGGGGGSLRGGGGGAGGLLTSTTSLNPTSSYTVTVGAGGVGAISGAGIVNYGSSGSNSSFDAVASATGGGGGASSGVGLNGGSGGGGTWNGNAGGTGISGQGFAGGAGTTAANYGSGGGGGSSAVGAVGTTSAGGNGGAGTASSITGSSVTYAGGGGGGINAGNTGGTGGSGGGSNGISGSSNASPATANTGGGGGGGGYDGGSNTNGSGGNGGSGVVIISYVGAQQFSGGVVTSSGGNTIHTFTTSGTLGPVTPLSANYLVIAGGGSGGNGNANIRVYGGGGAGGLLTGSGLVIDPYSTYLVTVGAGGAGQSTANTYGFAGSSSSFSAVATTAVGGGSAGTFQSGVGGSGGGGGNDGSVFAGAAGTAGQGNAGGNGDSISGGGGGGSGAVGGTGASGTGGVGGAGTASSISGTSTTYAGGGGGGGSAANGAGGAGGGSVGGTAGTANTGGGSGGTATNIGSGAGGSGVVIISYAGATQLMAGGVVTIAGGNVIHTFNSSGYLTPLTLLNNSLRFRSSASAYLNKTFGSAPTSRTTMTMSMWFKVGALSNAYNAFFIQGTANNWESILLVSPNNTNGWVGNSLRIAGPGGSENIRTNQLFRDPAAWYHMVVVYDTTNATASDRVRLFINGSRVTSFAASANPSQNQQTTEWLVSSFTSNIGTSGGSTTQTFDGYLAEVNVIDGQALAPTAFGTFNSYGVWQPITYGGSYGTNGFRLPFTNNASTTTLGYDFSPQGNNWTTNNISVTAGATYDSMTDVPTLTSATAANFATLNPLAPTFTDSSATYISQGNLLYTPSGDYSIVKSTMDFPASGKFYLEITLGASGNVNAGQIIGIMRSPAQSYATNSYITYQCLSYGYGYDNAGSIVKGAASQTTITSTSAPTNNDVISIAFDADNQTVKWYKNNTLLYTLNLSTAPDGYYGNDGGWVFATSGYGGAPTQATNFGQRPFAYTPPSGYVALNTFNL